MKTRNINTKEKIKKYFFDNPSIKLRVRQIERKTSCALPSVIRYTKELEERGILKLSKVAEINLYSANRNSKNFLIEKRWHNIKKIYDSRLVEFLINKLSNPVVVVFGSYSKGEDVEASDIDLYIETPSKIKNLNLKKFEKILNKEIQFFIYTSIKKVPNPHLANNIINGEILNGFLEVL